MWLWDPFYWLPGLQRLSWGIGRVFTGLSSMIPLLEVHVRTTLSVLGNLNTKPTLNKSQIKMIKQVFEASNLDPLHHMVFSPALKDRIQATGRRRGGRIPYWVETTTQRHFRDEWNRCSDYGILGPNLVYAEISRSLQRLRDAAPMRANQHARP